MKPTIGRIVYVRLPGSTEVSPLMITEVHSDTCISGQTFGRGGGGFHSSIVQSKDVNNPAAPFSTVNWDWMPYQQAQEAAKAH